MMQCETNEVPLLFHLALVSKLTSLGRGRFFKILIIQKPREYQKPLVLKIHQKLSGKVGETSYSMGMKFKIAT